MSRATRGLLFFLFFVSGFCGLVYQVIWTRLAFASFGIITPVLSVVLSVFMAGLAVGSWAGGKIVARLRRRTRISAALVYGAAELIIGLGAIAVPHLFAAGSRCLITSGEVNSFRYLAASAVVLAISILPWCVLMGATFPLMMGYIREQGVDPSSFSYLYLANVLGAMSGTFLSAVVLIEIFGFHDTLRIAATGNFIIAIISFALGARSNVQARPAPGAAGLPASPEVEADSPARRDRPAEWLLFTTGFVAMAMEVVWCRAFTSVLSTEVYSFAFIVFAYLAATSVGSWLYRRALRHDASRSPAEIVSLLPGAALIPVLASDPRFLKLIWENESVDLASSCVVLAGICPFCALLGYLTPALVDRYAAGRPKDAGRAYAINVVGCIIGPLLASYALLPHMSAKCALLLLSAPLFGFSLLFGKALPWPRRIAALAVCAALAILSLVESEDFEQRLALTQKNTVIRRDYTASVISFGDGLRKRLLVNGVGMTILTPITKMMVHLPMAMHQGMPHSVLVICFGMGTSFRSAMSWGADTTAVELVPSVRDAFPFYHRDAEDILRQPDGRIIVDDGRRFLNRTREKYDVIIIDPPPPASAAGSSLLYSTEFYSLAKQHLNPGGILQMWYPGAHKDPFAVRTVFAAIDQSFPHVSFFGSVEGWGAHMIASMEPFENLSAAQLAARMPDAAKRDLLEWFPAKESSHNLTNDAAAYLNRVLANGFKSSSFINRDTQIPLTDDLPYNEYFLLRKF